MRELIELLDSDLHYVSHSINNDFLTIKVKSTKERAYCPYCGQISFKIHSIYDRTFQDLPMMDKKVIIILKSKKYFCDHPKCDHKTFSEPFRFIAPRARKSNRLLEKILHLSVNVSSVSAAALLSHDTVVIGKSTILNLIKKIPSIVDKSQIYRVCVDDFAFKKRYTYGSILVDLDTHRIIDLLHSRDKADVEEWLKQYPNLNMVSRDGSRSYRAAIAAAHPRALQTSDRFHLLKNLSEAAEKCMYSIFPSRLSITATMSMKTPEILALFDTRNRRERILFARKKYAEGSTQTEIALLLHSAASTISKYLKMEEKDIPPPSVSVREKQHRNTIEKKRKKVDSILKLYQEGRSINEIQNITGSTYETIMNYVSGNYLMVNGHYDNRRPGKLQEYEKEIIELRSQGMTYKRITSLIREKGYTGTVDALRVFMQRERERSQNITATIDQNGIEYIARKWVVQLIYRDLSKVKGINDEQYQMLLKEYPKLGKIYHVLREYQNLIFSKNADLLEEWLEQALSLNIPEISSYVAGIKLDIDAVKNAITYSYNNGLAEGSVNKLKVIKRIMYGRNGFELLKAKLLRLEWQKIN